MQLLILRCTFVLLCFATTRISFAQEDSTEHCATDLRHRALLNADPGYAERFGALENQVNTVMGQIQTNDLNSSQGLIMGDTLEIPIVVHVIHSGQALGVGANISDSQIIYAVEALNDRYRMTAGTWGASGNGIDTEIQFVLAKRDPDCNSSNGIVRVNGSGVTDYSNEGLSVGLGAGADELEIKDLSRWPATDYLNVWVVTEIENNNGGGGIQGYAYFPGVSRLLDGLVIMHTAFGVTGTVNSWNNNNRTFAHEVGHYFSLYHTFEGDSNAASCPPTNNGCGTGLGDCCADIEPHIRAASNCPSGTNPCTSTSWGDAPTNYMNYSSQTCANMFSADQSDRMRASLLGARHSLLSSLGGVAPSGAAVASAACTPSSTSTANGFPMGIINLSFEGLDVTTSFAHPDSGYVDMSCTQQTDVYPSTTYSIDINTGLYYNQDVRVYMDYNNDGDFLDTLELAFSNNSSTTHSGNITIPANPTLNTPLRMRVIADWYGNNTALNAGGSCYNSQYGQTEDYSIYVRGTITASVSGTNVACQGGNTGSATVTVVSGTANYNYSWSNGASTSSTSSASNTISGLVAGSYTVTVTDVNSNTATANITITQPSSALVAAASMTQSVSCFGGNDGMLNATGTGGTGSFTFNWSNAASAANNSNLVAGTYTVTVTDANGCTDTDNASVNQPAVLVASISVTTNVACGGGATGALTASASGGNSSYSYIWSNSATAALNSSLTAGSYTVTVTDGNGCTDAEATTLGSAGITATINVDSNVSCNGLANGELTVSTTGGANPISYAWSNGATTSNIAGVSAGTYTVTVTENGGCTATASGTVTQPIALIGNINVDSNASCNGLANGGLTASSTGGTTPYTYAWSNSATTASITGLVAGTYSVEISDANGCIDSVIATVTQPATSFTLSTSVSNVSCNGAIDGAIDLTVTGGASPLIYAWSNAASSEDINSLSAGSFTVTVTDNNGCVQNTSEIITEPAPIDGGSIITN